VNGSSLLGQDVLRGSCAKPYGGDGLTIRELLLKDGFPEFRSNENPVRGPKAARLDFT